MRIYTLLQHFSFILLCREAHCSAQVVMVRLLPFVSFSRNDGVDIQNWHDEDFLDNLGRTGQTSPLNRSDRSRQICQIANWTTPLRRSRRDDRNAYIERLIRSPDEGVMPPGRPAPRSKRSDRSRAVRPVQRPFRPVRNAQSDLGVIF